MGRHLHVHVALPRVHGGAEGIRAGGRVPRRRSMAKLSLLRRAPVRGFDNVETSTLQRHITSKDFQRKCGSLAYSRT